MKRINQREDNTWQLSPPDVMLTWPSVIAHGNGPRAEGWKRWTSQREDRPAREKRQSSDRNNQNVSKYGESTDTVTSRGCGRLKTKKLTSWVALTGSFAFDWDDGNKNKNVIMLWKGNQYTRLSPKSSHIDLLISGGNICRAARKRQVQNKQNFTKMININASSMNNTGAISCLLKRRMSAF